jgi:hypothetical protein
VVSSTRLPLHPRYPLDRRLGGPQNQSGLLGENSYPHLDSNSNPSVVQRVASRYTDCAISALYHVHTNLINPPNTLEYWDYSLYHCSRIECNKKRSPPFFQKKKVDCWKILLQKLSRTQMESDTGCSQWRIKTYSNNRNAESTENYSNARILSAQTENTWKQYHQGGSDYMVIRQSVSKLWQQLQTDCCRRGFCGSSKWRRKF